MTEIKNISEATAVCGCVGFYRRADFCFEPEKIL